VLAFNLLAMVTHQAERFIWCMRRVDAARHYWSSSLTPPQRCASYGFSKVLCSRWFLPA